MRMNEIFQNLGFMGLVKKIKQQNKNTESKNQVQETQIFPFG